MGDEEPYRVVSEVPPPERRLDFARFGFDGDGRIVVAQRFSDRSMPGGPLLTGAVDIACVWGGDVFLRFAHDSWTSHPDAMLLHTIGRNVPDGDERVGMVERWTRDEFRRWTYAWEDDSAEITSERAYRGEIADVSGSSPSAMSRDSSACGGPPRSHDHLSRSDGRGSAGTGAPRERARGAARGRRAAAAADP